MVKDIQKLKRKNEDLSSTKGGVQQEIREEVIDLVKKWSEKKKKKWREEE